MAPGSAPPGGTRSVDPGRLTALLREVAGAPDEDVGWLEEPRPGELVERFRLIRRIGRGGFGVVFEARDEVLGRLVALKLVKVRRTELGSERLLQEAEAAARLTHPNVATLYDVGRGQRGPFLVLELLRGESLAARLARGPVPLAEAVRIAGEVARALAFAHRQGIVHRDLKPANVFLCEDAQVKVLDFGMAHAFGRPLTPGGTPAYMAPEQASGAPEDERTDVYALGVTLYEVLSGVLPGGERHRPAWLPPERLAIPAAPALAGLIHRMLERDPVRRPRSCVEVAEALQPIAAALAPPDAGRSPRVRRRRRGPLLLATVAATLASAALVRACLAPSPPPAPRRVLVAVPDVVNDTGEKDLEILGLLRTILEQSTFLDVLPQSRLVDALGRTGAEGQARMAEAEAREAAAMVGARSVVQSRLLRLGETYVLELRAVDPASGESLFAFKDQVQGKDGVAGLLDRCGEQARLRFGEEPAAIRQSSIPVGQVTGSLEAWRAYAAGMACFEGRFFAGTFGPCLAEVERATAIDSGFALAHLQASVLRFFQGQPLALQQDAARRALANPDRIPPHDRQRLLGWAALLEGRDVEAKALLRAAAEASPQDKLGWYLAGEVPFHRDEFAEALPLFRRAQALDPAWVDAGQHLIFALGVAGDLDAIRALARDLGAQGQRAGALTSACYALLWVDPGSAVATCRRAMAAGGSDASPGYLAIALLNTGDRAGLEAHLARMTADEARARKPGGAPGFAWYMNLWLLGEAGRWAEVERVASAERDPADAWFHVTHAEVIVGAGDAPALGREALRILELDRSLVSGMPVHLAYLGDLPRAAELERYLPREAPRGEVYQALVRWRTGHLEEAIAGLRRVAAGAPVSAAPDIPPPLYLLGEALAEAGRDAEAVEALRRYQRIPILNPTWFRPRSAFLVARCLDRLGDRDGARASLAPLLARWTRAGDKQPHLAEARELGRRLGLR